jgi:hypothetical protein
MQAKAELESFSGWGETQNNLRAEVLVLSS